MKKTKVFRIKIKLEEVIEAEDFFLFPLFENSQICSGVDQIKLILNIFKERLDGFIENTLNLNDKKK